MNDIRGWLTKNEAMGLARLASGKTVLEIGSFCGLSTVIMAKTATSIYAVDWHKGDEGAGYGDTLSEFWGNLKRNDCRNVIPLVGSTKDLDIVLAGKWAGLAFVDGAHDYHSVVADLRLAGRCLRHDGILAMHDWDREEVRRAYEDVYKEKSKAAKLIDTLAVFGSAGMELSTDDALKAIGDLYLRLMVANTENSRLKAEAQDRQLQLSYVQQQLTEKIKAEVEN